MGSSFEWKVWFLAKLKYPRGGTISIEEGDGVRWTPLFGKFMIGNYRKQEFAKHQWWVFGISREDIHYATHDEFMWSKLVGKLMVRSKRDIFSF